MAKVIVITGAGVGLGRALARRFAADGDTVIALGRTLSKVEAVAKELGGNAMAVACDVTSPESIKAAFATIAARYPKIDVLINNAAVYEPFLIADATDEQILASINTNFAGPIFCSRAAIPMMGAGGHIINVSSESVGISPFPHMVMYQSSKAGMERFSLGLHHELEPSGIRVTNVRAGSMVDLQKEMVFSDPAAWGRFHEAAMKAGLNLRERPISMVDSVTGVFRAVVDMPADANMTTVEINARKRD